MNVLADNREVLKYIEIWDKIEALFNKKINNKPVYNNEYIKTKMSPYNKNFHGNKELTKDEYYGLSILLLESICEVKNKYYSQTFLDGFFGIYNDNNINS